MHVLGAVLIGLLVAVTGCSSSSGGIGDGEGGSGGASTTTGATAVDGPGTSQGSGGAGGARPLQNAVSLAAWARLQGEFDSEDQEGCAPPPRRLLGCAVDAPAIGERVVYVERTDLASGAPERQFLLSFSAEATDTEEANATVYRPLDPGQWVGQCEPLRILPLLGDVSTDEGCAVEVSGDDVDSDIWILTPDPIPAGCMLAPSTIGAITPYLTLSTDQIAWADMLTSTDGSTRYDPPAPEPGECGADYVMTRRTVMPEVPSP